MSSGNAQAGARGKPTFRIWHINHDCIQRDAIDDVLRRAKSVATVRSALDPATLIGQVGRERTADLVLVHASDRGALPDLQAALKGARLVLYGTISASAAREALAAGVFAIIAPGIDAGAFSAVMQFILHGHRYVSPEIVATESRAAFPGPDGDNAAGFSLLDQLPVGAITIQGERVTFANSYVAERFGYTADELNRIKYWTVVPEARRNELLKLVAEFQRGDLTHHHLLVPLHSADGRLRWAETFISRFTAGGEPCLIVLIADVTRRMGGLLPEQVANVPVAGLADALLTVRFPESEEPAPPSAAAGDHAALTDRQNQVLALIATGASNRQIAAKLAIRVPTVKLHVHSIIKALGVANRTEAALVATRPARRSD